MLWNRDEVFLASIVLLEYTSFSFLVDFFAFLALSFRSMALMRDLEQTFAPSPNPVIVVDLPSGLLSNDTNFSANFISGVILDNEFPWFPLCLSSLLSPLLPSPFVPSTFPFPGSLWFYFWLSCNRARECPTSSARLRGPVRFNFSNLKRAFVIHFYPLFLPTVIEY